MERPIFKYGVLLLVAVVCINMGGGTETSTTPKPFYTKLEDDETSFRATIKANGKETRIKDINFGGKAEIEQIEREGEKGRRTISFENIKKIEKDSPSQSEKDPNVIRVIYTTRDNVKVDKILFPKNLVVSGLGLDAGEKGFKLYWQMHEITEMVIDHPLR